MDHWTAFVAIANLKLRLEMLQRHPELLNMEIRRPMELAGLKSRLQRAKTQEARIAGIGKRYDTVMDKIDELSDAADGNVGSLEQYEGDLRSTVMGMIAGDNGAPPLDEPTAVDGQTGQPGAQPAAQPPVQPAVAAPQPSMEHSRWP